MREIKFRAWHPKFGEMIYSNMDNEYQDKIEWYPVCFEIGFSHYPHSIMDDETILMQYTGQKDKDGKERYEGDIAIMTTENGYSEKGVIIYNENSARFGFLSPDGSIYSLNANDERIKIIGNIYQNPEYLT